MANVSTPYLSIVACSRNDNHGGDLSKRMQIFVNGLIYQCNQHLVSCELILVEWNPPVDRPPLSEILPQTTGKDYLKIRYIIVPSSIHRQLNFSERLPLFQMIAKNVGIRRAKSPFVLCTNIDLLFSDALFSYLAAKELQSNCFYRAKRVDIPNSVSVERPVSDQLQYAQKNQLKKLGKREWFGISYGILQSLLRLAWSKGLRKLVAAFIIHSLDKEACGDFTLMSKADWERIRGYPELEIYSLHIDSMGLIAAAALGLRQRILPSGACSYHLAHAGGWEFKDKLKKLLFYTDKPVLDWWSVHELGVEVICEGRPFSINGKDWGLAEMDLLER